MSIQERTSTTNDKTGPYPQAQINIPRAIHRILLCFLFYYYYNYYYFKIDNGGCASTVILRIFT